MSRLSRIITSCALLLAIAAGSLVFSAQNAAAQQNYPGRPITVIVPYGAGGHPDTIMRILQGPLEKRLGQKIVIQNRAGGGGLIGAELGLRAKPDGYTVTLHPSTSAVLAQFTHKDLGFDLRSLVPVSQVAYWPWAIIISTTVPANNVKEFVDLVRASPGKYKFNTSGVGTLGHLMTELFMIRTGTKMVHVPYPTGNDAALSMENGETQMNIGGADSVADTPGLKALCMVATERQSRFPDLPTCVEAGVPDFTNGNWAGLFLPPGTPAPIVNKLSAAVQDTLKDPDVVKRLAGIGDTAMGSSPEDFRKMRDKEFDTWKQVVETIGFKPE